MPKGSLKNNLKFYQHRVDAYRHPKFVLLRTEYGNDGWAAYGRVWALFDMIGEADGCILNLTVRRNKGQVADALKMSIAELETFLEILCGEDIGLLQQPMPECYTAEKIKTLLGEISIDREYARQRRAKRNQNTARNDDELFRSSPEQRDNPTDFIASSPELMGKDNDSMNNAVNVRRTSEKFGEHNADSPEPDYKQNKTKQNNTRQKKTTSSVKAELLKKYMPDFASLENITEKITALYKDFNDRTDIVALSDIDPIFEALEQADNGEGLTFEIGFEEVIYSFVAAHQAGNAKTNYLLGILSKKLEQRRDEMLRRAKKQEMNIADTDRNNARADMNYRDFQELVEFYNNNPKLFKRDECAKIDEAIQGRKYVTLTWLVQTKMDALTDTLPKAN